MTSRLLCLGLVFASVVVHAQDFVPAQHDAAPRADILPLSFDEALAWIELAPELRARNVASRQLRAARSEVSSLPSDLALSIEAGARVHPMPAAQGRVGVTQSLALTGLGSARSALLRAHADALDAERTSLRLVRRMQVGQAWLRVHAAHAALRIAGAELELAREIGRVSERGAQLSELTRADAADAAAYAAEAQLGVLSAEGELTQARLDLSQALAVSDHVVDARGEPPRGGEATATMAQARAVHARIEQQPALFRLARQLGVLDARTRELRAAYGSQLALGVALDRSDPNAWAALALVGLTFPTSQRNRRERAELEAERTALQGTADEQRAVLHLEIERLVHEVHHSRQALRHADTQLLPATERGLQAREALFRAGEGTVLDVILARRIALGLRLRRLRLQSELHGAVLRFAELASAVGVVL